LWAQQLAEQEHEVATDLSALILQAEVYYNQFESLKCTRPNVRGHACGGISIFASLDVEDKWGRKRGLEDRMMIGCSKFRNREAGHTYFPLRNFDIPALLSFFGPERARIHADILEHLNFSFEEQQRKGEPELYAKANM